MSLLTSLLLGFVLGLRHATDADHVVAVSTIVSRERSVRATLCIGALWGLGHALTILIVGGAIVALGVTVPPQLELSLEMAVALMLIALGTMNLRAFRHTSDAPQAKTLGERRFVGRMVRPFIVGVIHGLAGSAAVALLMLTTIRDPDWALCYLGLFGVGTVLGMMALTALISWPILIASRRFAHGQRMLASAAGLVSVSLGLFLAYQIGFVEGLVR